jgi:hypothetical protein
MFVRYLGGGIGHLEQFPPADNDSEVVYEYEDDEITIDGNEARELNGIESSEDGGDDSGEDSESAGDDEHSDPGESSDEDMGDTY